MPLARAAADPPDDPAQLLLVSQGLTVAEDLVEGVGAGAEFGGVGFGVDNAAGGLDIAHHQVGLGGDVVLENRRATGGADPLNILQIFNRHRHAGEQATFADRFGHQRLGVGAGAFEAQRRHGVKGRVDSADPRLQGIEKIQGGDLFRALARDHIAGGCVDQVLVSGHGRIHRK